MFKLTKGDIEFIEEVQKLYPTSKEDLEMFKHTAYITVRKNGKWYEVSLCLEPGERLWLKSTTLPVIQIKRAKYLSGCTVYVDDELLEEVCNADS